MYRFDKPIKLKLDQIKLDGGTQPRELIDEEIVAEYASAMMDGDEFPPITVFNDGANYWLADGFHRYHASKKCGYIDIYASSTSGTRRDAVLFSVSANAKHGLRRTNADKRKAVETLLNDEEWSKWSDSEIGRRCFVSHKTVAKYRPSLGKLPSEKVERTYTTKHGTTATMKVENIGKKEPEPIEASEEELFDTETGEIYEPKELEKTIALQKAHEAIAVLKQIPLKDRMLQDAYDTVIQWINVNR